MKKFFSFINSGLLWLFGILIIIASWVVHFVFLVMYPMKIEGKKNLKKAKGAVVACNHYSNLDGVLLCAKVFRFPYSRKLLAKKELSKNRFFGWVLKGIGAIFIDRNSLDREAMREADKNLKKGKKLIVFPEGTRNKNQETEDMGEVKSGVIFFAKKASVPIIPMRIVHRSKMFKRNKLVIGEPYFVGETGKKSTEEEVKILTEKMNSLATETPSQNK